MAALNFEPWQHVEDEWTPPSNEEWVASARSVLPQVRVAWFSMYKTKAELEAIALRLADDDFEMMVDGIIEARKYFEGFVAVLNAAECRIVCAASTVEYRESGPDDGEA